MTVTQAAVLAPLIDVGGAAHVIYIQRSADAPVHPGDLAFPGGRHHPERDESLLATALREAEEEIGLRPRDVEVAGALPEVRTLTSSFLITPFIGRVPAHYPFRPDPREVAAVLSLPLAELQAPGSLRLVRRRLTSGAEVEVGALAVGPHVIWGATYRITVELLRVVSPSLHSR
jgi:8-oxo-dGTP pyrophosphatase MutT (NUDIX family)